MVALSMAEKMAFARWIDLGAPIDLSVIRGNPGLGWFLDDLKPTLTISSPRINYNPNPVDYIRLGVADAYTGIDLNTLSITANFSVNGRAADSELSDLAINTSAGIYQINLDQPVPVDQVERHIRAEVADNEGNIKRVDVRFYTANPDLIFVDGFE